jgi:hypothetical protein
MELRYNSTHFEVRGELYDPAVLLLGKVLLARRLS